MIHKRIFVTFIIIISWAGCIGSPEEDLPYQRIIDLAVAEGIPGAVLLVRTPNFEFIGVKGYADIENKILMDPVQLFRIASTSKLFIGVLSAMLHYEGVITLDDPITHWLPPSVTDRIQYADNIIIKGEMRPLYSQTFSFLREKFTVNILRMAATEISMN